MKKKPLAVLTAICLLCALPGCRPDVTEPSSISESALSFSGADLGIYDENYEFDSSYAKTKEYFFAAVMLPDTGEPDRGTILTRVRLDDFTDRLTIPINFPFTYNGKEYYDPPGYDITISGITSKWIFLTVSAGMDLGYTDLVLQISLDGKEQICVGESKNGQAWFNPQSHVLYLLNPDNEKTLVELYALKTGKKIVLFGQDGYFQHNWVYHWHHTADGLNVLEEVTSDSINMSNFLLIDGNDQAKIVRYEDIRFIPYRDSRPRNSAETLLSQQENIVCYVTCLNYVYYVEETNIVGSWEKNLYRMKPDNTEKKLLRSKTHIRELMNADGELFALAEYEPITGQGMDMYPVSLHKLDIEGKPVSTIATCYENENSRIGMRWFEQKIMLTVHHIYGKTLFEALYNPANGQSF